MPNEKLFVVEACVILNGGSFDDVPRLWNECARAYMWFLLSIDIVWGIAILIQLWLLLIVAHFVDELYDEEELAVGIDIKGPPPFKMRVKGGSRGAPKTFDSERPGRYMDEPLDQFNDVPDDRIRGYRNRWSSYV